MKSKLRASTFICIIQGLTEDWWGIWVAGGRQGVLRENFMSKFVSLPEFRKLTGNSSAHLPTVYLLHSMPPTDSEQNFINETSCTTHANCEIKHIHNNAATGRYKLYPLHASRLSVGIMG